MKTIVIEGTPCPKCGKPMPTGALAGLCPGCLLAQGMETEDGAAPKGRHFEPPPLAEVAKLFPQLEIQTLLGAGGMGAVYKARQPVLDRIVALKILPAAGAEGTGFEERFNREARALARLSHPNIVAVHEFGKTEGLHFFIMEFVDGTNLRQLEQAGRLAPREALQIIPQICDALQYAHDEGVVHRDIKPENVLVDRKGRVKIADFGLAKILGQDPAALRLTAEGQVMGTPHYMAPEQIEKPLTVDHRADIYSLGVVLYEMLTGDLPLGKFSPPSRKVEVDVRLDDVVLRALENDPERRYQKASEVKSQVETIVGTPAQATSAAPPLEQNFIRWAGFPVVVERDGTRRVNRKEEFKMFGIFFGLLTVAFGLVSIIHGQNLFGWLGIAGSTSLLLRLGVAALVTEFGLWRALRSRPALTSPPQTPQGTVILPPERFSRKAIVGVCWIPFALFAFFGMYSVRFVESGATDRGPHWWQILLAILTLPLGFTAPFGTTILGWLAVGDIRRSRGRLGGLPLAVFDGLFFPLLALDGFLVWAWVEIVNVLQRRAVFEPFHAGEISVLTKLGAAAICVLVNLWIIRRVWRAVRLDGGMRHATGDWWWSSKRATLAIAASCVLVIVAAAKLNSPGSSLKGSVQQVAGQDQKGGGLIAKLPNRGTVELLAVSDGDAPANAWWRPDGVAIPDTLIEAEGISRSTIPDHKIRNIAMRWRDVPNGVSGPTISIDPQFNSWSSSRKVWRDGEELAGGSVARVGLPLTATVATLRMGFGIEAWRTISFHNPSGNSSAYTSLPGVGQLQVQVHQITENKDEASLTLLVQPRNDDWFTRVVALDADGAEQEGSTSAGTPTGNAMLWTYSFRKLPLARVKQFRVEMRPVYWVEFRGVALEPRDRNLVGKSSRGFKPTAFSEVKEVHITELFDFDTGKLASVQSGLRAMTPGLVLRSAPVREQGVDAAAGINELRLTEMEIADLAASEWGRLKASEMAERLSRSPYAPPRLPSARETEIRLPLAYAFRTREKGIGMFELVSFDEGQAGVTLRYKIVERAHFE